MKIIIVIEKYGGFCNRLFQSLHYHAYSIEKGIKFFNPSMLGLLKFDNKFFYTFDRLNNFFLKCIFKFLKFIFRKNYVCFYLDKNNYIKIVGGWNFRKYKLIEKHNKELNKIYRFESENFSKGSKILISYLENLKKKGKYIIGLHIRRNDYKYWNSGKYYFSDDFYQLVINNLRINFIKKNKDPFFVVVSDEKISSEMGFNLLSNGSWKEDQIILQNCDLLVGPPSTFTMWASYISQIPLIKISSDNEKDFVKGEVCNG